MSYEHLSPIHLSPLKLCLLSFIPLLDRPVITYYPGIDLALLSTGRALKLFSGKVAVGGTNAEGGGKGIIRKVEILGNSLD